MGRYRLTDDEALDLGISLNKGREYRLHGDLEEKVLLLKANKGIKAACDNVGVDISTAKMLWLKTRTESVRVDNPYFKTVEEKEREIDFTAVYKEVQPIKIEREILTTETSLFDRLVYSDVHIGMDPNGTKHSMYPGEWNEEILFERLETMVKWTILNQKSNTLIINDLGDFIDGYNGETTRGGHKLPQNMDNQKMFDVGLKFKLTLLKSLAPFFSKIICVNITNDNHAGSFSYLVNSAFKTVAELMFPTFEIINQRKFIDHYIVKNKCFILSHGKDDANMKFGYKPKIDSTQILKIKDYIDQYNLSQYNCEFSKGDSHCLLLDYSSSRSFEYQNFGAFSPPSEWVKLNFSNTKSTFTHFNYLENQKLVNNYIF